MEVVVASFPVSKIRRSAMSAARAQEPRSWDPPANIDLSDHNLVALWSKRLQVTPTELEEVVERVNLSALADAHRLEV
jgi:hypothetical protein